MRSWQTVRISHHWQRRWAAIGAAAAVFALYLPTVPRDLAGVGVDSAKFAYLPHILGVPHPPGYPVYMLIGWAFSHLPIGSLAFRMNLLSSVFGAATAFVATLIAAELGCPLATALLAGFLVGTGPLFWSQAIVAEVYTLHNFLIATMFFALLRWARTRRTAWLYVAASCFGLGLAHHTDIAVFVPAILLFLALTDVRVLGNVRVVVTAAAVILLLVCFYLYVPIRTAQGATYIEVAVRDLRGMLGLVRGDQFDYLLFRQPLWQSLRERGPIFVDIFVAELGVPGLVLALFGVWAVWRRSRAAAAFVLAGIAGVIVFALSYFAVDVDVFLLPALVLCWILAAAAASTVPWRKPWARGLAAVAVGAWMFVHVTASYRVAARQSTGFDARFARTFFQLLPRNAAIVDNSIEVGHTLLYKIFGERATAGKDLLLVTPVLPRTPSGVFAFVRHQSDPNVVLADVPVMDRLVRERSAVFVFGPAASRLRAEGFSLDPVQLPDLRLDEYLASRPPGHVVVAAVPRLLTSSLLAAKQPMFRAIGSSMRGASPSACYSTVGVTGAKSGAIESGASERLDARRGQHVGEQATALPVDVSARCGDTAASILINGRELSRTDGAIAIAVLNPAGDLVTSTTATANTGLRVPFDWIPMSLYRINAAPAPRTCVPIGSTWANVTSAAAEAGITVHVRSGNVVRMYVWSDEPLRIRAAQVNDGEMPAEIEDVPRNDRGAASAGERVAGLAPSMRVTRLVLRPKADDRTPIALALGGRPLAAAARIEGTASTEVCALSLGNYPILAGSYDGFERVLMDDARADLFGNGWHDFEDDGAGGVRWTSADQAHLLVPLSQVRAIRVIVDAMVPPGPGNSHVSLIVNGRAQSELQAIDSWNRYMWTVPAAHWRTGINDVAVGGTGLQVRHVSGRADRMVGLGVREIDFQREP